MIARPPRLATFALAATFVPLVARSADRQDEATPQRPSLSFNTLTVRAGHFELELGGTLSDSLDSLPLFLKYGLSDGTELEVGFDAVRRVDEGSEVVTSQGDLLLGVRARVFERSGGPSAAVVGWIKAPTAKDGAGSGEFDVTAIGVASLPIGRSALDLNLWLSGLGQSGGAVLGQVQGIGTFWFPARAAWSPFVELALQDTAVLGGGGYLDAGVSYAASRRGVFDLAAGVGWSEGYPDWSVTVGWTFLAAKTRRRPAPP